MQIFADVCDSRTSIVESMQSAWCHTCVYRGKVVTIGFQSWSFMIYRRTTSYIFRIAGRNHLLKRLDNIRLLENYEFFLDISKYYYSTNHPPLWLTTFCNLFVKSITIEQLSFLCKQLYQMVFFPFIEEKLIPFRELCKDQNRWSLEDGGSGQLDGWLSVLCIKLFRLNSLNFFPSSWRCMRSVIASLFQWAAIIFMWLVDSRSPNWPFWQAAIATDARSLITSPTFFGVIVNFATDRSVEHIISFPHHCCMWSAFYYSGSTGSGNCLVVKLHRWKYGRLNFSNSCDIKTCQLFF